jgi:GNAT superfamily N-acetyltransferase
MSLESALENYPKPVKLKSGLSLILRPLVANDYDALREFFGALPSQDLMFLKERISDPAVIRRWCTDIDYGRNLLMLALHDKQIAGLCSLHQHLGGWKRHIGRVHVHTLPQFRGKNIGRTLVTEMMDLARECGVERLEAEFFDKQVNAMKMFGFLGFSNLLRLHDYVKDMQAVSHDYILMGIKLITDEEYAGMG